MAANAAASLRADTTAFMLTGDNSGDYLCSINITIPVLDAQNPVTLQQHLLKIQQFLFQTFTHHQVSYQLTASYRLVDPVTQDERLFTGSFLPQRLHSNSLSGDFFLPAQRDFFVDELTHFIDEDRAVRLLGASVPDSRWQLDSITSFILVLQTVLPSHHPFLQQHQLTALRHVRRHRRHVQFLI
jgi:hypothetical protein